jgi:hypothetical protein
MKESTTTWTKLRAVRPQSETEWRGIAARAHRLRGVAGDEAAALTHELHVAEIRNGACAGSSMDIRICPRCEVRGAGRYMLIFVGGMDRCGTCGWTPGGST